MTSTESYFEFQYNLVKGSRRVLFDYCRTISNQDFINQNSSFGRGGSIRNLLVHIANTYQYWIIKHVLAKDVHFTEYASIKNIDEVAELFSSQLPWKYSHT